MLVSASAFMVVTSPNLVHSAVSLLFTLFGVAAIYIYLYADFIAATQIVIYVGGILVLIIFGVMLTNKIDNATIDSKTHNKISGLIFSSCISVVPGLSTVAALRAQRTGFIRRPAKRVVGRV